MHPLEHLLPFGFGIDLAVDINGAFLHDLHHALVFACIEPETVIVLGAGIQFEIVEAVLKFIQSIPAMRAGIIRFGLEMNERAFVFVFVESDVFQLVEFLKIEPHASALRA